MSLSEIIDEALHLNPQERYLVIDNLVKSLNEPNGEVDEVWIEESQKRLKAYHNSEVKTYSYEDVFN